MPIRGVHLSMYAYFHAFWTPLPKMDFVSLFSDHLENGLERLHEYSVSSASLGSLPLCACNLLALPVPGPASLQAAWLVE